MEYFSLFISSNKNMFNIWEGDLLPRGKIIAT